MTDAERFLAEVLPAMRAMETAFHNGDASLRSLRWSHQDPVTLFGAAFTQSGWRELAPTFDWLASRFSDGSYDVEVIAAGASGDLAYIAGIEHSNVSIAGAPPSAYELRVTTVFRREDGEWKIVHRHADPMPGMSSTDEQVSRIRGEARGR